MRIALAQINTTVGDFEGNLAKITAALERGRGEGVELLVFPEQAIPGYPAEDLLERQDFLQAVERTFEKAVEASGGIAMVLGTVCRADGAGGKPIYNSAALVHDGKVLGVQHKTLLPTYDVFDEARYFRPATSYQSFTLGGRKLGLPVCEDLWNDPTFWPERRYSADPVEEIVKQHGADLLVSIHASPFSLGKQRLRYRMLKNTAERNGVDLVYCNLVGGNTSLVFDGASMALDRRGGVVAQGASCLEDFVVFELPRPSPAAVPAHLQCEGENGELTDRDIDDGFQALVLGTRDYLEKTGFHKAVVGLSGGIDSAVTAVIATEAIGRENVLGVSMPSRYSSEGSMRDAEKLAATLGIQLHRVPIEGVFRAMLESLKPFFAGLPEDVTEENIQARIRGMILMGFSNKMEALLLTTGNKSELAVGYCTLYGDMSGGLAVISDLPKTLVYRIARQLNRTREIIPWATIEKAPSAELRPDQKDQDTLPDYAVLDPILQAYIEDGRTAVEIAALGFDRQLVDQVIGLVNRNEYKRKQAPPGLRITRKAFGPGRRFPIVQKFRA